MIHFIKSLSYPFKGVSFLFTHVKLFKYFYIPFIINLVLALTSIIYLFKPLSKIIDWLVQQSESNFYSLINQISIWTNLELNSSSFNHYYSSILTCFLNFFATILILILFPFILTICSSLITPIFRSFLYSKTKELAGSVEIQYNITETLQYIFKTIFIEIRKVLLYLFFSILLFLLNLVPIIGNIAYLVLQFLLTALFVGWESLSPWFEEKMMSFKEQYGFIKQNRSVFMGFGIPAALLLLIPLVQAFFLLTHTIGGALLSIELEKNEKLKSPLNN